MWVFIQYDGYKHVNGLTNFRHLTQQASFQAVATHSS